MRRVALDRREGPKRLPVADHHELPRLAVACASRPACHLKDVVHYFLRDRVWAELAYCPQSTEEGDTIFGDLGGGHKVLTPFGDLATAQRRPRKSGRIFGSNSQALY